MGKTGDAKLIFVCGTCDRYKECSQAERSGQLLVQPVQDRIARADAEGLRLREVACLNGCLHPCNVAFRGTGRWTYRFSRLSPADLERLIEFAAAYWKAATGEVPRDEIPESLHAKLTVRTAPPPEQPGTAQVSRGKHTPSRVFTTESAV